MENASAMSLFKKKFFLLYFFWGGSLPPPPTENGLQETLYVYESPWQLFPCAIYEMVSVNTDIPFPVLCRLKCSVCSVRRNCV